MSGKFYKWNTRNTLVLDPGVFAWDLPRRGADWQVGYFPRDGMGAERTITSDIEKAGQPFFQASEQAASEGAGLVQDIKRYFQLNGMGENGTVSSELEEAGTHLVEAGGATVRAGEAAVFEAGEGITKAPDWLADYAMRHPWMTLLFGASLGVFLTAYVSKRRRMAANPEYEVGDLVANKLGAVGKVVAVHDNHVTVNVKSGWTWSKSNWPYEVLETDPRKLEWSIARAQERGEIR
jgi:hypothetical protein